MFTLHNVHDGEVVYQKSIIIIGRYDSRNVSDGHVQIETSNEGGRQTFPTHRWPVCDGWFKCLVILSPGKNVIQLRIAGDSEDTTKASQSTLVSCYAITPR